MKVSVRVDPVLRALGSQGRYQILQGIVIGIAAFGAAYQLLDNVFIGRAVEGQQCAAPGNTTNSISNSTDIHVDNDDDDNGYLHHSLWNATNVTYGQCEITVSKGNLSGDNYHRYPCLFGYQYGYRRELSFRTEFDLVCDKKLLGSLMQTLVIAGQGVGAVVSAIISDRFGRKRTLIGAQCGLLVVGMAIGLSPSYPVLMVLKFLVGGCQQAAMTGLATMAIELFPHECRSLQVLVCTLLWGMGSSSMTLSAYLLRDYTWRYLQYTLSAVSLPICLLQLWYLDESLRWLVANGRKEAVMRVLKRAARVNRKDLRTVLQALQDTEDESIKLKLVEKDNPDGWTQEMRHNGDIVESSSAPAAVASSEESGNVQTCMENALSQPVEKDSIVDIFRHGRLFRFAAIIWLAWFTGAFAFFALYMMSTSLHGDRFLNYFLTAVMELPPGVLLYLFVNRVGRRTSTRSFYILCGTGLICSGVFRLYKGHSVLATLSVVFAMMGMLGASGVFASLFFYTPELFPTNLRSQALGMSSLAGRLGGVLAPFMIELAQLAIWAPGVLIGTLCLLVIGLFHFLPETKGRELPQTIEDVKAWHRKCRQSQSPSVRT